MILSLLIKRWGVHLMLNKSGAFILFFISAVVLGAILGWTIGRQSDLISSEAATWITAIGTTAAVVVALGFGVVTHRRETQFKKKDQIDRLDRASALAVVFDHELTMVSTLARVIRENINEEYMNSDIQGLVNLVDDGLEKMSLPLLESFLGSLSDFSPKVAASLLVVISRFRQMQNNGPIPSGEGVTNELVSRSLIGMKKLLDTWIHDIDVASEGIRQYHNRIAEISVKPPNLEFAHRSP